MVQSERQQVPELRHQMLVVQVGRADGHRPRPRKIVRRAVGKERRALVPSHRIVHEDLIVLVVEKRDDLQLLAETSLDDERPISRRVQVGEIRRPGRARDVRSAKQVGLVHARVVFSGDAVAVGERSDVPHQAALLAECIREVHGQEHLIDALLGLQVAIAGVGLVVGIHDHRAHDARISV